MYIMYIELLGIQEYKLFYRRFRKKHILSNKQNNKGSAIKYGKIIQRAKEKSAR